MEVRCGKEDESMENALHWGELLQLLLQRFEFSTKGIYTGSKEIS